MTRMLRDLALLTALVPYALGSPNLASFPEYRSLAGLSPEEARVVLRQLGPNIQPGPEPLPPPISDTGPKLVNDKDHPYMPDRPGDVRGPCPGLNTLASHGSSGISHDVPVRMVPLMQYIDRSGVASPNEIITAVQEGFNMGYGFAAFFTFTSFIVDGNVLTNKMTIGGNVTVAGSLVTGIDTQESFEGDARIAGQDAYFGHGVSFSPSAFDVLIAVADSVGNGTITVEAAALDRKLRIEYSIENNPEFYYETPRFVSGAAESGFMLAMFVHDQTPNTSKPLSLDAARDFFQFHRFPDGFYRRQDAYEFPKVNALTQELIEMVGISPGHNEGKDNYIVNEDDPATFCYFYQQQARLVRRVYHDPPPEVIEALKKNLEVYYQTLGDPTCERVFPYGK